MYNFKGGSIAEEIFVTDCDGSRTQVLSAEIDIDALNDFRYKFPAWMDADTFNVIR